MQMLQFNVANCPTKHFEQYLTWSVWFLWSEIILLSPHLPDFISSFSFHQRLLHSFTSGSKHTCFTNPFNVTLIFHRAYCRLMSCAYRQSQRVCDWSGSNEMVIEIEQPRWTTTVYTITASSRASFIDEVSNHRPTEVHGCDWPSLYVCRLAARKSTTTTAGVGRPPAIIISTAAAAASRLHKT